MLLLAFGPVLTAQTTFGLSGNTLVQFDAAAPGTIVNSMAITGIDSELTLAGIDFRPATGQLYAIAYSNTTGMARLYVIDTTTGAATAMGSDPVLLAEAMGKVSMDFNPTVDRIRVVGSNNANFRMHPVTGAVVAIDGMLAFAGTDPNGAVNPSIGAVAYTNSYIGTTSTTLINYDDSLNVFCSQIPPNAGTLNTLGSSGLLVDLTATRTDFDIYYDNVTNTNIGFFCANLAVASAVSTLYTVDLATGATTLVGVLGMAIDDIAVAIAPPSDAPIAGQLAFALNAANALVSFDTESPESIRTQVGVSGITAGQTLVGMDFRPATGELIGLGYNPMNSQAQLYTINTGTGMATAINAQPFELALGNGTNIGFDFNPTVDRIRVVAGNNANFRLNPINGTVAATDGSLAFAGMDNNASANPAVTSAAYTNSFDGTTSTTLYVYDDSLNVLCTQIPPNDGILNTIGQSGITLNLGDPTLDMDIYYNTATATNIAYAVANATGLTADSFYEIDLATGQFMLRGTIGWGVAVRDIAIVVDDRTSAVRTPLDLDVDMALLPNPAQGSTTLRYDIAQQGAVALTLTDMTGRTHTTLPVSVQPAGSHQTQLDVSQMAPGLYILQLRVDGQLRGRTKLVIQ